MGHFEFPLPRVAGTIRVVPPSTTTLWRPVGPEEFALRGERVDSIPAAASRTAHLLPRVQRAVRRRNRGAVECSRRRPGLCPQVRSRERVSGAVRPSLRGRGSPPGVLDSRGGTRRLQRGYRGSPRSRFTVRACRRGVSVSSGWWRTLRPDPILMIDASRVGARSEDRLRWSTPRAGAASSLVGAARP